MSLQASQKPAPASVDMDLQLQPPQHGYRREKNTGDETVAEGGEATNWLREFQDCSPKKGRV